MAVDLEFVYQWTGVIMYYWGYCMPKLCDVVMCAVGGWGQAGGRLLSDKPG